MVPETAQKTFTAGDRPTRMSPEGSGLLTAAEVAELLRVPLSWVRKHGKELPGLVRLGKYVRWSATELDRFIAGGGLS